MSIPLHGRLLILGVLLAVSAAGCSSGPGGPPVASTGSAIASSDTVSRAMEWVDAKLHYCESAYGQPDYDTSCSSVCRRQENKAWDAYRSDCSGFVTWAWGLPPVGDGGYVTSEFAPYSSSFSHVISGASMQPGDALNRNSGGHIVLFKQWETPGNSAVFMEEPGCSSPTPYAHEFSSHVSVSGSDVYIDYEAESFTAIRFNGVTDGPPPPPPKVCGAPEALEPPLKSCGGSHGGVAALPSKPTAAGAMSPGEGLGASEEVSSPDGRFRLVLQSDGNVVLYSGSVALWNTGTNGKQGHVFVMQTDGNLVLYSADSCALWASNTSGHAGASLAVQNDGNVVVYGAGKALWSSRTGGVPAAPTGCGAIGVSHGMSAGESVLSCDGRFQLTLQSDGNLVLYISGKALWATGTDCQYGRSLSMQSDGNLVLYSNTGAALWSSKTSGHSGATLAVQNDGNLVVYDGSKALWASGTSGH